MILLLVGAIFLVLAASPVYAQEPAKISDIVTVIRNIISILAPAAAIAFLIMFLWAGFQYINSRGDPKNAAAASQTIKYALAGIILVAVSWLILQLIASLTGVDVTTVQIPQ